MSEYLIQGETLDAIADAINAKTGGSSAMTPAEMVTAIGSISGGGGVQMEAHSVHLTLASSATMASILQTYCVYAAYWRIYPTDAENTAVNTIAVGQGYCGGPNSETGVPAEIESIESATGVTVYAPPVMYLVNDQTYSTLRSRGNINPKPAGDYQLDFYGVAK